MPRARRDRMSGVPQNVVILPKSKKTGEDVADEVEVPEITAYIKLSDLVRELSIFTAFSSVGMIFFDMPLVGVLAPIAFMLIFALARDKIHYFKED